jgi:hypothetical protein
MGKDQTVQFENVPLNEGNGFNNYTGVFTVPRSGVYMLIFLSKIITKVNQYFI